MIDRREWFKGVIGGLAGLVGTGWKPLSEIGSFSPLRTHTFSPIDIGPVQKLGTPLDIFTWDIPMETNRSSKMNGLTLVGKTDISKPLESQELPRVESVGAIVLYWTMDGYKLERV